LIEIILWITHNELYQPPTYPTLLHLLFWWIWGMLVIGVCIRTDATDFIEQKIKVTLIFLNSIEHYNIAY